MKRCFVHAGVVLLFGSSWAGSAYADESFWINSGGGNFTNPANWTIGVPGSNTNANFTNNASYQVSWIANRTNANVFFNAGSGTVTQAIGGFFYQLTNSYVVGQDSSSSTGP